MMDIMRVLIRFRIAILEAFVTGLKRHSFIAESNCYLERCGKPKGSIDELFAFVGMKRRTMANIRTKDMDLVNMTTDSGL